jgi:hypothetical protein
VLIAAPVNDGKADVERKEVSSVFEILSTDISLSEFVFSAISVSDEDPFIFPDRVKVCSLPPNVTRQDLTAVLKVLVLYRLRIHLPVPARLKVSLTPPSSFEKGLRERTATAI